MTTPLMSSHTAERDAIEAARVCFAGNYLPTRKAEREMIAARLQAAVQRYDAAINAMRRAPSDV